MSGPKHTPTLLADWLAERGLDESNFDVMAHADTWNKAVIEASLYLSRQHPLLASIAGEMMVRLMVNEDGRA